MKNGLFKLVFSLTRRKLGNEKYEIYTGPLNLEQLANFWMKKFGNKNGEIDREIVDQFISRIQNSSLIQKI